MPNTRLRFDKSISLTNGTSNVWMLFNVKKMVKKPHLRLAMIALFMWGITYKQIDRSISLKKLT
jgi:hypothetical protein